MATKYAIRIKAAPKVGGIYWCDFHPENVIHVPEFWKKRPVVVVSRKNTLHGKIIVLPMTTDDDNALNENAIEVSAEVQAKIDGKRTWVVCDHPVTVATSRLDNVSNTPPRIKDGELTAILHLCHSVIAGWNLPSTVMVIQTTTTKVVEEVEVALHPKPAR